MKEPTYMQHAHWAEAIWTYFNINRAVGHTQTLIKGAKATGAIILCHTEEWARQMRQQYGVDARSVSSPLTGLTKPLIVDNYLLVQLLGTLTWLANSMRLKDQELAETYGLLMDRNKRIMIQSSVIAREKRKIGKLKERILQLEQQLKQTDYENND